LSPLSEYRFQVLEKHLDTFGHVNNAQYLVLYEEARWDLIENNGFGINRIKAEAAGPVLLEATVKFKRELKNREWIRIQSFAGEMNGKLMVINQQMVKPDGKIASEASFTVGFMDLKERRLIVPPDDWLKIFGYLNK